jgi:large subunit ribosomal protein L3
MSGLKLKGKKLKMTQVWKDEVCIAVTPVKIEEGNFEDIDLREGDKVKVSGITKGRGFQGVVKRHGFGGGPKSHGQKDRLRAPGSIGPTAPQRTIKGRKMAGHMGVQKVTIKNLEVVSLNNEDKIVFLKGAVPGFAGSKVILSK